MLMEGLEGPTPDESFVVPAHLTGLAFMQDSTARSISEVSAQAGSDNDMLSDLCTDHQGCRERVSPVSTEDSTTCRFLKASTRSHRPLADLRCPAGGRRADRPEHLLRHQEPHPVGA